MIAQCRICSELSAITAEFHRVASPSSAQSDPEQLRRPIAHRRPNNMPAAKHHASLQIVFGPVLDKNVEQLKILNTAIFPVRYKV